MTSLFIEHREEGIAFYINGDLQFDSADEAIYHEYLVIPTLSLALRRFGDRDLRVLICGGGDGLAAREVLRFPQVSHIDLVDYSDDVLELGRTVFKEYNNGSLESDRIAIHVRDAFEFIDEVPASSYHAVIGDFTYPTVAEDTIIYSQEWFQKVNLALEYGGIFSTNGVSPSNSTIGFWCLYQTLLASGLSAKPLQLAIPSFRSHGYGNWGFFLASQTPIEKSELEAINLPDNLHVITGDRLLSAFVFESAIANLRHNVSIHTLKCPQLFYYLLNSTGKTPPSLDNPVDFLDIQESGSRIVGTRDWLQLESAAKAWIEQSSQSLDINKLLPIQHRYHTPQMRRELLAYLKQLLAEIDLSRLLNSILARAQELPPQMAQELKSLSDKIRYGQVLSDLSPETSKFLMMLSVTLLMSNMVAPDAVFAKGYYGGSYSSSGSGYSTEFNSFSSLTSAQSTGLKLMGWGVALLVILGLTYVDWSGSNDE